MRTFVSAVAGIALLGAPVIASAHPRFERGWVGYRAPVVVAPVVVAPAYGPAYYGPVYAALRPVFFGHAYWHPTHFVGHHGWR